MDNLSIMNGLVAAREIVRGAQFGLAGNAPILWDMHQRILKYIDNQQREVVAAIRG